MAEEKERCLELAGIPDKGIDADRGYYEWMIDRNAPWFPIEKARIRITDVASGVYDFSDSSFTIEDGRG